ncbi:hypothetical protein B0A52_04027 [Exophiala mesophila]|uniref:Glycoside hydrolase family 5 domain-containing protein n=1 Tax=Exophiala mesophila TaxID=212818 RepID=A0A438NA28_EXOME|nr:hypothetical protein B0A52_04027 [Exophiala mesophila]
MVGRRLVAALLAATSSTATPILKRDFAYGSTPVRGANIGGWLLLEPYLTPSIFEPFGGSVFDEYTFTQNVANAGDILQSHWDSWASLEDFQKLANNGFNLVRIPIGYWAFQKYPGDPYIQGAADYLEKAIGWARQTGLVVSIDLHGAPLSQNGFDNSGQRTSDPGWTRDNTVDVTLDVIGIISRKYATSEYSDVVAAIELVNEPVVTSLDGGKDAVVSYYQRGFDVVRSSGQTAVVISDGSDNPSEWNDILTSQGAIVDHHYYHSFGPVDLSYDEHVQAVYSDAESWARGQDKLVVVGEWSGAMTDCAPFLNGVGYGARYDGTYSKHNPDGTYTTSEYIGSCAIRNHIEQWDDGLRAATYAYLAAQIDVYENQAQGSIFWNFKSEGAAEWDLFRLIDYGVWPGFN